MIETLVYRPLLSPLRRIVSGAQRLQSGRLDTYITDILIVVVAPVAVVVGLA